MVPVTSMTVAQLARMAREQVDQLDPADRQYRRDRLAEDDTPVGIRQVAVMAGCGRSGVSKWRSAYLATGEESDEALCEPDPDLNTGDVRKPGEVSIGRGDSPKWRARTIRGWLRRTGRADEDYFPRPGGRKPPGRPPRPRDESDARAPRLAEPDDVFAEDEQAAAARNAAKFAGTVAA